jgi:hypothetical protein
MSIRIQPDQYKQHDGKCKQGCSSITDKREGNANDRGKTDRHSHINDKMKEDHGSDTISITTAENASLSFGDRYYSE